MKVIGPVLAAAALLAVPAMPDGSRRAAEAPGVLDGIERVYVRVDYLSEIVTDRGLRENDLLVVLANRLRDADLLVLSAIPEEEVGPLVVLALDSIELPSGDFALHGSLELREVVELTRLDGVAASGSTWYSSILAVSTHSDVVSDSRELVTALADEFVMDLAAANL